MTLLSPQYYPSQPVDSGVGILGGVLSGIGGVVCGIVSFLASCADERAHHYTMPIGMAAKEGWDKNTWQIGTIGRKRRRRRSGNETYYCYYFKTCFTCNM